MAGLSLNKLVRAFTDTDKVITPRHTEWLIRHGDDPFPDWVVDRIAEEMKRRPRKRAGTFSASASGKCWRAQELGFLGAQQVPIDPQLQSIFTDGKFRHLRWQAQLLTSGILTDIEFPLRWKAMRAAGGMDGIGVVPDDHPKSAWAGQEFGFELKGVSTFQYQRIIKDPQMKQEHVQQFARYFLMSGLPLFVVVYEDKTTQAWNEWVVEANDQYATEQRAQLRALNDAIDRKELHPMLAECRKPSSQQYQDCPYGKGGPCLKAGTWPRLR